MIDISADQLSDLERLDGILALTFAPSDTVDITALRFVEPRGPKFWHSNVWRNFTRQLNGTRRDLIAMDERMRESCTWWGSVLVNGYRVYRGTGRMQSEVDDDGYISIGGDFSICLGKPGRTVREVL